MRFEGPRSPSRGTSTAFHSILLLATGLFSAGPLLAAPPIFDPPAQCIFGWPDAPKQLNCTSNDVSLSTPVVSVVENCQYPGDTALLQVLVDITLNATSRYDIGVWVSVDGDPNGDGSESGLCSVLSVPPGLANVDGIVLDDGDQCGDIENATGEPDILQADLGTFTVLCNDSDGDGNINLPLIVAWENQPGGVCTISTDALPGTAAKCNANLDSNIPVPVPARLTVTKVTAGGDTTSFGFNLSGTDSGIVGGFDGDYNFQLANGETFDSATAFTGGVLAGAYSLTEDVTAGWISEGSCVSIDFPGTNTDPANLTLEPGENVECEFTNTPDTATLTVVKQSIGDTGSFDFTGSGTIGAFSIDTTGTNPNQQQFVVTSGTYSLAETVPAGWTLDSASCSGANNNGSLTDSTISGIELSGGDSATCTFVNAADGTLTLRKVTEGGDGTFNFTTTFPGAPTAQITTSGGTGTAGGTIAAVPGDYNINETVPAGWEFVSASCTGATAAVENGTGIDIEVGEGETISCTFTNQKLGTIVVEKVTDPAGGPDIFEFTGDAADTIADGEMITVADLSPDDSPFDATEVVPDGWDLTDITCDDDDSTGDVGSATATFNVAAGEIVTCTFTNTELATVTIVKALDGDPTGLTTSFDFTSGFGDFSLDPINTTDTEVFTDVTPGDDFSITESGMAASWGLFAATCGGQGEVINLATGEISNIDVEPGDDVTCTFTNMRYGSITVEKQIGGDVGELSTAFDFTSDFGGAFMLDPVNADSSMVFEDVAPGGEYAVSETLPEGWQLASATCGGGETVNLQSGEISDIALSLGQDVTCVFANRVVGSVLPPPAAVPTMNRFGLALLALLMLGAGLVGYRRFG